MAAGDYDRRITVQGVTTASQSVANEDAFGQSVKAHGNADGGSGAGDDIWAKIEYGSGGERRVGAAQEQSVMPVTVQVRKSPLTSSIRAKKHRLAFDDVTWDIEAIEPATGRDRGKAYIITATSKR